MALVFLKNLLKRFISTPVNIITSNALDFPSIVGRLLPYVLRTDAHFVYVKLSTVQSRSLESLTSVFGMGTGVTSPLWPLVTIICNGNLYKSFGEIFFVSNL